MHETSLAQSIISIVKNSLPKDLSKQVTAVHLNIGILSGIEQNALLTAFDILKKQTVMKDASLIIDEIKGMAKCLDCNTQIEMNEFGKPCGNCGSYALEIVKGREMNVSYIETED
jgi:hydrogenase nickel incorporation protein HypA/HybF